MEAVLAALEAGDGALEAVTAGAVVLEDHPEYNAGTGASCRLDGRTIEMDASLMDDRGRIGAVGAIERVKNPIKVARIVLDSPHILIVGPAATRLARNFGFADHDPSTPSSRKNFEDVARQLATRELPAWRQKWLELDLERYWNFDAPYAPVFGEPGCDTIGVVASSGDSLAVALSTGGASPMLAGRIGDTPLPGAGFWASPHAAVAMTGVGEEIARGLFAKWIHDRIADGIAPQAACEAAVARFPPGAPVGAIAVSPDAWGTAANRDMAWAAWTGDTVRESRDA